MTQTATSFLAALDSPPDPGNPLAIDGAGLNGLEQVFRFVAVSAGTLRDAGFPEKAAWELVLAAKHIRKCMQGVDHAIATQTVKQGGTPGEGKIKWSKPLRDVRTCTMRIPNRAFVEA